MFWFEELLLYSAKPDLRRDQWFGIDTVRRGQGVMIAKRQTSDITS